MGSDLRCLPCIAANKQKREVDFMANTFRDFFPDKSALPGEEERVISKRLPPFKARPIDETQASAIRKSATKTQMIKGTPVKEIDAEANMLSLIAACVSYPDLQDAALQEAWGVMGAEGLIKKMLLPGEYAALSDWIAELCGFNESLQELVEQAKN